MISVWTRGRVEEETMSDFPAAHVYKKKFLIPTENRLKRVLNVAPA